MSDDDWGVSDDAWGVSDDDYRSQLDEAAKAAMADSRPSDSADLRRPDKPTRVIHLPQGMGPRESLNLDDPEDLSRLIVFFVAELEEIRVSIARLIDLSG